MGSDRTRESGYSLPEEGMEPWADNPATTRGVAEREVRMDLR
jgi:hypothetical protein